MSIYIGKKYSSYLDLQKDIDEFAKLNNTTFYKREASTLKTYSQRIKSVKYAPTEALKYYLIKFSCIGGGREHKKRSKDDSRRSKTYKQNCPMFISVGLSTDRKTLEIKKMHMEHRHIINEAMFRPLPKERRLPLKCQKKVRKCRNRQQGIKKKTVKDISNIAEKNRSGSQTYSEIPTISEHDAQPNNGYDALQHISEVDNDLSVQVSIPEFDGSSSVTTTNKENNSCAVNYETPLSSHMQNKRTIISTESVDQLRKKKRYSIVEKEDPNRIMKNQEIICKNTEVTAEKQDKIIEEQQKTNIYLEKVLQQQEKMNEHLQSIAVNIAILTQICSTVTRVTVAEE